MENAGDDLRMLDPSIDPESEMMKRQKVEAAEESKTMDQSKGVETKPMKKKIKKRHRYFELVDDEELERMEARWKKFEEEDDDVSDDSDDLTGPEVDQVSLSSDSDSDLENNNHYEFDNGERIGENVKSSNFTREEVNQVPVNGEEWKIQMDDEEKMYDKYMRHKTTRPPTKEQKKILRDANRKSQGFDIPLLPGVSITIPYRVDLTNIPTAYETVRLSKLALQWYNKDKGTKYVVQRIVKSTGKPCAFVIYCITFLATSNDDPAIPAETFQARVWVKFNFDVHIMMCRKKGDLDPGRLAVNYDDDVDDDQSPKDEDGDNDDESLEDDDQPEL